MPSPNGFQNVINSQPGVAAEGDFADANIRAVVVASAGALVAAPSPRTPIVGRFAWGDQATGLCYGTKGTETTSKIGFVHRENQAIVQDFLAASQLYLEPGLNVTLYAKGSFWARFAAGATVGDKVFASNTTGACASHPAGSSVAGYTETAFYVDSPALAGELAQISTWG